MPSYIHTKTLAEMNKAELEQLYRILLAEYHALPEDAPAKLITGKLLSRIRHILHRKTAATRYDR